MERTISIFKGKFRRLTAELIMSAVLVSFLEAAALWLLGFLKIADLEGFMSMMLVLSVIEIILIILIEQMLISARVAVRTVMSKRKAKRTKK